MGGPLLLFVVLISTAGIVMFFVLHRETRTRKRRARDASPRPVDEDPQI